MLTESNEGDKHKDLRPSEIRRSNKCVPKATEAIKGFLNSFDVDDRDKVYCLSSGAPTTDEIEDDILCAEKAGEYAKELFITERLMKKQDSFEPITQRNLKTFVHQNQTAKVLTSKNKLIEYKQQGNLLSSSWFNLKVQKRNLA